MKILSALYFLLVLSAHKAFAQSTTVVFTYTAADQTFTVPTGVAQITIKAWGAGGAGGLYGDGGGGGFATSTLTVTPNQQLKIIVGGGGLTGSGPGVYGGGGPHPCGQGGRGGGRSAVRNSSNIELITAGAGGAGGGEFSTPQSQANGGGGGGLTGTPTTWAGVNGEPGTQNAGGICHGRGTNGSQFQGGETMCWAGMSYAGSGGGGYYGGGAGYDVGNGNDGAGGGGSSFIPAGGSTVSASGRTPGNTADPDYAGNAGYGGVLGFMGQSSQGNPGRIVITYTISNHLVISMVYGEGSIPPCNFYDDIELFNPTSLPVSLNGYSVQYATGSSTSGFTQVTPLPNFILQPGQYFLVTEFGSCPVGPTATPYDLAGSINLGNSGKVFLVNNTVPLEIGLSGCPVSSSTVIDFVGYGNPCNCSEGSGPATTGPMTFRNSAGCVDTDNNSSDFTAGPISNRNSSSPFNICPLANTISFSPATGPVGTTVTITGPNFNATPSNNIVYFGAVRANVTAATTSSLTVTAPAGANYIPISVLNNATGVTRYSSKPFITTFTNPFGTGIPANFYQPKVDFTTGNSPQPVVICDVDIDGKPDIVVANAGGSGNISVFRNTSAFGSISASSFASKVDFTTGLSPNSIAVSDLDADGKPDIVIANASSNTISILRNTSTTGSITTSSFADKVDFATGGNPRSVAVGDVDGDGKPDLAVISGVSHTVSIFRNTSTPGSINSSSFAAKVDFATGLCPYSVAIGDIDGDGKPDMAVTNYCDNSVSVFRNTSTSGNITTSSFAAKVDFNVNAPVSVAIADMDIDGKPDLVIANYGTTVSILRNTSTTGSITGSSFANSVNFNADDHPRNVAIGDVDGDGKPDLAVTNYYTNTVSVLRNISSPGSITAASFASKADFVVGSSPFSVAIGDVNGDGIPELVSGNEGSNTISVLTITKVYTFTGTGNWNITTNWSNNTIPPSTLPASSEIIIDPSSGACILNVPQTIGPGGKLTVKSGKNLVVNGNLTIQ